MHRARTVVLLALALLVSIGAPAARAFPPPPPDSTPTIDAPVAVRLYVRDRDHLNAVAGELDIWEVHPEAGYVVAAVTPAQYEWLESLGYRLKIDAGKTALLEIAAPLDPRYYYFDDYYPNANGLYVVDFLQDVNAAFPDLTELIDIGDAWMAGQTGEHDRDIWILRITNEDPAYGPIEDKPAFFLFATIHAREVAIPELAIRYIKYLTGGYGPSTGSGQGGEGGYGLDPDVTWLVDHDVAYVLVMQNPDGHWKNEENAGNYRRKNMDWDNGCSYPDWWGVDLNRNHSFLWGCCGGSSSNPCNETYRGPSRGSEPETQAFEDYFATVMRDQNGPNGDDEIPPSAPITTTGIFISLHSYSDLVLWPWGFDNYGDPPNYAQLRTIGRKFAYYNGYDPAATIWYNVDGATDDWTYGKFGIPSYTFEVGPQYGTCGGFFPPYECIDGYAGRDFWAENKPAFLYAHKIARTPYVTAYGPDAESLAAVPGAVPQGTPLQLTATIADHRYGDDPLQPIAAAEYFVDAPGEDGAGAPMAPADGNWGGQSEVVTVTVDTSGLALGQHYLLVHGRNDDGDWGPFTAVFATVLTPTYDVALTPATAAQTGNVGESVAYTLTVTNLGSMTDTYALALSDHVWTATLSITTTGEIVPLGSAGVQVTVDVPLSAGEGQTDTVTATATSQGDGTVSDSSVLATTAACVPVSGANFTFAPAAQVGQTFIFTGTVAEGAPPITYTWNFGGGSTLLTTGGSTLLVLSDALSVRLSAHGSAEASPRSAEGLSKGEAEGLTTSSSAARVGNPITHTFPFTTTAQTYTVTLTAANGCPSQDTASKAVTVWLRYLLFPVMRNYSP